MTIAKWINQLSTKIDTIIVEEIEDALGAISNERLWANGSNSSSEAEMHLQNADELSEYVEKIKKIQKSISNIYNND